MAISITQEQAAALLPLLPQLVTQVQTPAGSTSEEQTPENMQQMFSADEMLTRKKKNTKSTSAQRFLLTVVRESAKAANIWDNPPLMRDITATEAAKFYDTAFTLCPQLKSRRHLLATRLSKTLINRRQLLRRLGKLNPAPSRSCHAPSQRQPPSCDVSGKDHDQHNQSGASDLPSANVNHNTCTGNSQSQEIISCVKSIAPGTEVAVLKADRSRIGKGLFLKMKSNETYEQFGQVLFMSAQKVKGNIAEVELPAETEKGKQCFSELEKGDIFLWKTSRLQPYEQKTISTSTSRLRCTEDLEHDHEPEEMLTDNESSEDAYDHDDQTNESDEDLSEYEIRRKHRIAANKKKFEEHYAAIIAKKVKQTPKSNSSVAIDGKVKFHEGEHVLVKCDKYQERPLIGRIATVHNNTDNVTIEWLVGTYSGTWKLWRGRKDGKPVVFSDVIPVDNILMKVHFTKSWRLPPKLISAIKELYLSV